MSAAGRRARRLLRRATNRHEPGSEAIRIDDLVSPLRYDVLVRERFLAHLRADPERDPATSPAGQAYLAWFRAIVIHRFKPDLIGREDAIREAFAERVRASMALIESFESQGYDPSRPITLLSGRKLLPTATGKSVGRGPYAGDGCHRLALLRLQGVEVLEPGSYRVQIAPSYAPLDNTAPLIPALGIGLDEYLGYLALTYAPGRAPATTEELLGLAADLSPDRIGELTRVLEVDTPLLTI